MTFVPFSLTSGTLPGDVMYGAPTPEDRDMHDGCKIKLSTAFVDGERAFDYVYDYGDNWCCVVVLEAVAPMIPGVTYPRLVEGARHGPPEDVGCPWSYGEFLEDIADSKHERHKELLEWCGGDFDPQQFDVDEINPRLASLERAPAARPQSRLLAETYRWPSPDAYLAAASAGILTIESAHFSHDSGKART